MLTIFQTDHNHTFDMSPYLPDLVYVSLSRDLFTVPNFGQKHVAAIW